ncbi:MAG: hypothetical protein FK731_00635 [Asgard group archaeon]|nr:hypothetical protein [Asgard group archaeon]
MSLTKPREKQLSSEKSFISKKESVFCLDCIIDWCKIRNKVTYCTQKYRGTSCYSCDDGKCSVKKLASS